MPRWGLVGVWLCALSACDGPTQLLVIVDSDLGDSLAFVEVTAASGLTSVTRRFDVAETGLPFSFAVAPEDNRAHDVEVRAAALSAEGQPILTYRTETSFLAGRTLRLEIPLARACVTEPSCADQGLRCVHGICVEQVIDPHGLPEGNGPPTSLFDGPPPLLDAGMITLDGGCGAVCRDPERSCRVGVFRCDVDMPVCEILETLPEGTDCGDGRVCDGMGRCGVAP